MFFCLVCSDISRMVKIVFIKKILFGFDRWEMVTNTVKHHDGIVVELPLAT